MRLCVVGLGRIGLPMAALFADAGLEVVGSDTDPRIVQAVNAGQALFTEPGLADLLARAVKTGRLRATAVPERADAFILAVPTPLGPERLPDLAALKEACRAVGAVLQPRDLVVVESTVPPGATGGLVRQTLESTSGLGASRDFHLVHCPERALPGNALHEMVHNDRLVGGWDQGSTAQAMDLYRRVIQGELLATDATTAELAKLAENTYRDINIALANELAALCEGLEADVWQVVALANHHPRVHLHLPGPGVGGHCLPKDPWFLSSAVPAQARLIPLGRRINEEQPQRVVDGALALLREAHVGSPARVALFGVTYRGTVDDVQESPALPVLLGLREAGVEVATHDPLARSFEAPLVGAAQALQGADLLLVVTDHAVFRDLDPQEACRLMRGRLVLDTRNLLDRPRWQAAGFHFVTLGVGL